MRNILKFHRKNLVKIPRPFFRSESAKDWLFEDRLAAREYISINAPGLSLIPILWVGNNFTNRAWKALPDKFVIKPAHNFDMAIIVNKATDKYEDIYNKTINFIKTFNDPYNEGHHCMLLCEQFIEGDGVFRFLIKDNKIEMIENMNSFYTRDFQKIPLKTPSAQSQMGARRPLDLGVAIKILETLSSHPFLRVDLYFSDGRIYFGEITNILGANFESFEPNKHNLALNAQIEALQK